MIKQLLKEIDSSEKRVKQFAWLFVIIGILVVPAIIIYKHGEFSNASFLSLILGFIFLIAGLYFHKVLIPIYKVWMLLALVLGLIMTKVIITIVFYLIMTPIGVIKKGDLTRSMHLKFSDSKETYWKKKEWNTDPKRLEKLF